MPQRLYLRCKCQILLKRGGLRHINVDKSGRPYVFNVLKNGKLVYVEVMQGGAIIKGKTNIDAPSQEILDILSAADYKSLSSAQTDALSQLTAPILESIKQVVGLMKQELPNFEIQDELIGNCKNEWSVDGRTWNLVPFGLQIYISALGIGHLGRAKADHIQKLLSEDEAPLVATNHLHRAQAESGLRYKWIDATIAAELAIKEVLVRIEPKLEFILKELPAPPLQKLYGDVLKSITGEKAPDLKRIERGAKIRNDLVHRPESVTLDHDEVTEYVHFVDDLIRWLLKISRKKRRGTAPDSY